MRRAKEHQIMMLHIPPDFDKAKIHGVREDLYVLK
jgi:hypothetical protein